MARYSDVAGVRIIPPVIEFKDTEAYVANRINITVKNVAKTSKAIRYYSPQNTKVFTLKVQNPEKPVAPGLEVPAVIEFNPPENKPFNDRVMLTVDDAVIEIPIKAVPCQPNLILNGPIDFGNVVASSKVISREITLANHGSKAGDFKIRYMGSKPITILPPSGSVPPGSAQIIKVEYVTKTPGKFEEVAKVKLDGQSPSLLEIKGTVVEANLELLDPETEESLNCVNFGATYYGTDRTESAILFNNGPEPACFVAILNEDALGQEVGVDLTKSTAATLAAQLNDGEKKNGEVNELTSLVTAIPNQGMIGPYQKIPIYFRFSPRWNASNQGFKCSVEHAPRKDFALFLQLKIIGASKGFLGDGNGNKSNVEGVSLEVALTATALPVMLAVLPQTTFNFGECPVKEHIDTLCTLTNQSDIMPVTFQLRRVAHFTSHPTNGKVMPGDSQDVIFSFAPNQVGTFKPLQYIDVIGQVADNRNPFLMHLQVIHTVPIQFIGVSDPTPLKRKPVFNPGITPKITNEVGMYVDTRLSSGREGPAAALLNSQSTNLHRQKSTKNRENQSEALIAFPNDRACSIRPSDRTEAYKTIFTKTERHTFVDPDYAYTDEEAADIQAHKEYYLDFINQLRENRRNKARAREFQETNNDVDIAIKPAAGLKPKKLKIEEVKPDPRAPTPPNRNFKLLSTKELAESETKSSQNTKDGLNAVPTSLQEKADCSRILSPQELHRVVIGPPTIDFGQVCLRSVSRRELNIVNNLEQFIHIVVHVDCRELRQTSPLSQVIPPRSKAVLPLIFDSGNKGPFQRSLDFTINGFYKNHITVFAEVVPVALELSTADLVLEPNLGLPADAGVRGVINLKNKLNLAAEFTWAPILGERGTAFSIRPATGIVEAYKDLDCEVVFHPSFMAPEEGTFALQVHGGDVHKLTCTAHLGPTNVQFIDRRVMFGQVPLHLTTTRVAMIQNNSLNHAFFQVLDPFPFPGMSVSPLHGVVPVGGTAQVRVSLTPDAVIKFDTRIRVAIRGAKTLELRMGGTVEPPVVDIDLPSFNFGGVYCGSQATTVFRLANRTNTKTRMEFDLSRYSDFQLAFPEKQNPEDITFQLMNPGVYSVTLDAGEIIHGELLFQPTEVASYDFIVPVTINQTGAPSPSATPFPPTPAPSQKNSIQHIINPRPVQVNIATPRRKVIATALRQPLQFSHNKVDFVVSPGFHELSSTSGIGHTKNILLVNNSDSTLKWAVNLAEGNDILEEGVFKFLRSSGMPYLTQDKGGVEGSLDPGQTQSLGILFCPDKPGYFEVTLPVIINDEWDTPYQYITISGELKSPRIWFNPLAIVFNPVPLETSISAEFQIFAANYTKASSLDVEVPSVEGEDGSLLMPLSVSFPGNREIEPCCGDEGNDEPFVLKCHVIFKSSRPISFSQPIKFIDCYDNVFSLTVTATADNCLLTCYPFLAKHRTDHQIVCEQNHLAHQGTTLKGRKTASRESLNVGEAILVPCTSPPRPASRPSTTATSSNFEVSISSFGSSSQTLSDSTFPGTPREGALNKFPTDSDGQSRGRNDMTARSLGSALFPEEDSEEGIFHTEVLLAVQRWFSSQGWPGGPHPINIPNSLRTGISKKPREEKTKNAKGGTWEANNLKKEFKTVYDMVSHLSGKQVPGIPINNPLPNDPTERAKQVYWQHSTLLTFLKTQGACLSSIKPEYLMELCDYKRWVALQKEIEMERNKSGHRETKMKTEEEETIEDQVFEAVSKRAWTDVLLQLLKTVILARITPRAYKHLPTPYRSSSLPNVDPDPLCSNVYSIGERILLLWLNHHYEQQRHSIWNTCTKGGVPPSRWVVNFDFDLLDGLVLASAIASHAPFLIKTHLHDMYTQPATAEQCLHNALKVVSALRVLGIDYDIQAIDITDPNPISLLLLIIHLFNNLPHYLPKSNVDFVGALHTMVLRQVRLSNPSSRPLTYQAMIAGHDAVDFCLPKGYNIVIPPKSTHNLSLDFTSRFLRPAEATLVLVGRRQGSNVGSTLVFNLRTQIDNIAPKMTVRFESPCYELNKIPLEVTNPFPQAGKFKVVLVEARGALPGQTKDVKKKKKKVKKIRSRTNHGQNRLETPEVDSDPEPTNLEETEEADVNAMSAFHITFTTVQLEANGTEIVELDFLPFQTGRRQCSVIFINEEVGEFLYSVEASATLPLPAPLPFKPSPHSVRISSAAAAGGGRGMFGGDDSIVYWKCECGQELTESLTIPITNPAREKALVMAAQQHMTSEELNRRLVTGTLASATLTAKTVGILSARPNLALTMPNKSICLDADWKAVNSPSPRFERNSKGATFKIEVDSSHFMAPGSIVLPSPLERQPTPPGSRPGPNTRRSPASLPAGALVTDEGSVQLPVSFQASEPGHYPCRIILRSQDDVRVYHIECTVVPEGSEAQIEFTSPVHQPVTQNIPIVNPTNHDWPMTVVINGDGFVGPSAMLAKAYQTSYYPLIFRPKYEGEITGQLVLMNTIDNVEHKFTLTGQGERPLPLEQLVFNTTAKQSVSKKIHVPNVTQKKLYYRVESDLDFVSGAEICSVLPGKSIEYQLTVAPLKRGAYKGIVSFVAISTPVNENNVSLQEVDSDGDEIPDVEEESPENMEGYRVWYAVDVFVDPPPAEKTLTITCACQTKAVLEVGLSNPVNSALNLKVTIVPNDQGLSGDEEVVLPAMARGVYLLEYAPAIVGKYTASLIFFHPLVGEFWYHLELTADPPAPTIMPKVECELGRWVRQYIHLNNPTDELLLLVPTVSNINNFILERDNDQPIELKPHSNLRLPVTFMPSTLGDGEHKATISFHCEQLGAWEYVLSGSGRLPHPQDPVSITAMAGSNSTLIIPFRNPLDITVYADISLIDSEPMIRGPDDVVAPQSPFCLLLKYTEGIRLGPKTTVDVPVSFAPEDMKRFDALVRVTIRQESNNPWSYDVKEESEHIPGIVATDSLELHSIKWEYPINGYPELTAPDATPALVVCQARERVEERLEVQLTGVAPSAGGPKRGIKTRAKTPAGQSPKSPVDGVIIGEGTGLADEFMYELMYKNQDVAVDLEPAVVLNLVRATREKQTGLVMLLFNVIYAPYKTMLHDVELLVKGATGGLWKFPLRFMATEPEPDDVITISAIGLNKESSVGFRLTSQARHPMPYNAYFVAGSDVEFSVSPARGELLPTGTNGSLIKVSFTPSKYGKIYQGKLVIQTSDMQWTYTTRGVLPEYEPPRGQSSQPMAGPHRDPRRRLDGLNYVRDNLKLTTTAVSSPIKGIPVITKKLDKLVL